jgi:hypothetical protein
MPSSSNSSSGSTSTSPTNTIQLTYGLFYAAGTTFNGSFGTFVRT